MEKGVSTLEMLWNQSVVAQENEQLVVGRLLAFVTFNTAKAA